jgi:hypothetical protein
VNPALRASGAASAAGGSSSGAVTPEAATVDGAIAIVATRAAAQAAAPNVFLILMSPFGLEFSQRPKQDVPQLLLDLELSGEPTRGLYREWQLRHSRRSRRPPAGQVATSTLRDAPVDDARIEV